MEITGYIRSRIHQSERRRGEYFECRVIHCFCYHDILMIKVAYLHFPVIKYHYINTEYAHSRRIMWWSAAHAVECLTRRTLL